MDQNEEALRLLNEVLQDNPSEQENKQIQVLLSKVVK